ncbi:MAG TPA: hypothetical protein VD860_09295 [Azospirillum sp.]|nr:hypothetical protein [Azospirillum sp.]
MTTTTFSHSAHTAPSAHGFQAVREFLVAWFQATPVYFVYQALTHRG